VEAALTDFELDDLRCLAGRFLEEVFAGEFDLERLLFAALVLGVGLELPWLLV